MNFKKTNVNREKNCKIITSNKGYTKKMILKISKKSHCVTMSFLFILCIISQFVIYAARNKTT